MKLSWLVSIGLLIIFLPACSTVYVEEPIGETPLVLDPEDWEGAWLLDDIIFMVDVLDSENGLLRVAVIETDKGAQPMLETMTVHARDGGNWILGSIQEEDPEEDAEGPHFLWGIAKRQGDYLLLFQPDFSKFRTLIEEGVLPGRIDESDIFLGPLDPEHVALILSDSHGFLFDLDHDIGIATRITR